MAISVITTKPCSACSATGQFFLLNRRAYTFACANHLDCMMVKVRANGGEPEVHDIRYSTSESYKYIVMGERCFTPCNTRLKENIDDAKRWDSELITL